MARTKRKGKRARKQYQYWLVRGASGTLWLVNLNEKPKQLPAAEDSKVEAIVDKAEADVEQVVGRALHIAAGSGVHLTLFEDFPE